ncbi:MAG: hypothetical protein JRH13_07450 [Deltaproteobacteria bacterium]|nr:hypothetical protein [Deltaproteobacteria bacterium]MBW2015431.1 hypothetical protein [Deltaproteobacteria bacterium]MBW2129185.1 hypothetical protein [Deltaproteobacteria bacterium]MBW2302799.1 hypothetical protein [Deltaproteobacteria bacterium]
METQVWFVLQIVLDLVMVVLLLWFLKFQSKRRISWREQEALINRSESILSEMKEISRALEENLEEKRILSKRILERLDQGLKRAEESCKQITELLPKTGSGISGNSGSLEMGRRERDSIRSLLKRGLSKEEIARHLGISVGEIELMLKLDPERTES